MPVYLGNFTNSYSSNATCVNNPQFRFSTKFSNNCLKYLLLGCSKLFFSSQLMAFSLHEFCEVNKKLFINFLKVDGFMRQLTCKIFSVISIGFCNYCNQFLFQNIKIYEYGPTASSIVQFKSLFKKSKKKIKQYCRNKCRRNSVFYKVKNPLKEFFSPFHKKILKFCITFS